MLRAGCVCVWEREGEWRVVGGRSNRAYLWRQGWGSPQTLYRPLYRRAIWVRPIGSPENKPGIKGCFIFLDRREQTLIISELLITLFQSLSSLAASDLWHTSCYCYVHYVVLDRTCLWLRNWQSSYWLHHLWRVHNHRQTTATLYFLCDTA